MIVKHCLLHEAETQSKTRGIAHRLTDNRSQWSELQKQPICVLWRSAEYPGAQTYLTHFPDHSPLSAVSRDGSWRPSLRTLHWRQEPVQGTGGVPLREDDFQ